MLGIGQISSRIAELIRGALPYAIVNNDPNRSKFARLISYNQVQEALDAGHKWIQVRPSDVDYLQFNISDDYVKIQSSWGARFTSDDTGANTVVCEVTGDYNWIEGINTYTAGGATSGVDRRGFDCSTGQYNYFLGCLVTDSDGSGFCVGQDEGGVWNTFIGCHVIDVDDNGFYIAEQGGRMIGCTVSGSGGSNKYHVAGTGPQFMLVGNIALNGGNIFSGADGGIAVGNMADGTVSTDGTGSLLMNSTYNKQF